jgi:hypothetical protein
MNYIAIQRAGMNRARQEDPQSRGAAICLMLAYSPGKQASGARTAWTLHQASATDESYPEPSTERAQPADQPAALQAPGPADMSAPTPWLATNRVPSPTTTQHNQSKRRATNPRDSSRSRPTWWRHTHTAASAGTALSSTGERGKRRPAVPPAGCVRNRVPNRAPQGTNLTAPQGTNRSNSPRATGFEPNRAVLSRNCARIGDLGCRGRGEAEAADEPDMA